MMPGVCTVVLGGTGGLGTALVSGMLRQDPVMAEKVIRVGRMPSAYRPQIDDRGHRLYDATWDAESTLPEELHRALKPVSHSGLYPVVVINAIGVNQILPTREVGYRDFEAIMKANVWSSVTAAKMLTENVQDHRLQRVARPILVNIGSNAADGAGRHSLAYVASKHALTGVTRSLARDYQGFLTVLQVNIPKLRDTEMSTQIEEWQARYRGVSVAEERQRQEQSSPAGESPTAKEAAAWILQLVNSPSVRYLHGSILRLGYPS